MEFNPEHYPVYVEQSLQWGEMDSFNHINNTVYFKFFENARIKFMEKSGLMELMDREKIGPILARIDANYRIPLDYPDTIRTYIRVKSIGNTSFVVENIVWSKQHDKVACQGEGVIVLLDYKTNQKVAISDILRKTLESYQ